MPSVLIAYGEQCKFGAEAWSGQSIGMPVKKLMGFLTDAPCVAETLNKRCEGVGGSCSETQGGRHQPCSGRIASEAQVYPKGPCRTVFKGVIDQLRADGLLKQGCHRSQVADDDHEVLKRIYGPEQGHSRRYKDDLT